MDEVISNVFKLYNDQLIAIQNIKASGIDLDSIAVAAAADGDDEEASASDNVDEAAVEEKERKFLAAFATFLFELDSVPVKDPRFVLRFARGCKWRMEFACKKATKFFQSQAKLGGPSTLEQVKPLLSTGLLRMIPGHRDKLGRQIIIIRPASKGNYVEQEKERVRCLSFLMDRALDDVQTQVLGFVGVIDLSDFSVSAMTGDRDLLQETAKFLHKEIPARFAAIYVMRPPWFFKMILSIMKLLLSAKMLSRVKPLDSNEELLEFCDAKTLPMNLGGSLESDYFQQWLDQQ